MIRIRAKLDGVVQGVGFRPFIRQLAGRQGLTGWVFNATDGVTLEVQGPAERVSNLLREIRKSPPPAAVIDRFATSEVPAEDETQFVIRSSVDCGGAIALVSPDLSACADCLAETLDPTNRRFRYPFTNCANCGPRFTLIQGLPYDRPRTTMSQFAMCEECTREYSDPADRRYHAQPNACPVCGPRAWLEPEQTGRATDSIEAAARLLEDGAILAVKGLGGFHLACDATSEETVRELRRRKGREEKPLALMAASVEQVHGLCRVSDAERALLEEVRRPIVLLRKRQGAEIAESVAPCNRHLGCMLPYTPLHALLLADTRRPALVMTSANLTDEPLCVDNVEARRRLAGIAEAFLLHDRDIHMRCDDSVVKALSVAPSFVVPPSGGPFAPAPKGPPEGGGTSVGTTTSHRERPVADGVMLFRRARGYTPFPVRVGSPLRHVLAMGAELKSTFCFSRDRYLFLSQHLGDLQDAETAEHYREALEHFRTLFRIEPEVVAHDLHPDYVSTRIAHEFAGVPKVAVQHHHAHVASVMAEHGLVGPVLGLAFDGLGLGEDGTAWGGEILLCETDSYERVGHLRPVPMPGADAATREPWRMAVAHLLDAFDGDARAAERTIEGRWPAERLSLLRQMIARGVNCPLTSSAGRLFDAVSSLLGIRDEVRYEGQAAIELEGRAEPKASSGFPLPLQRTHPLVLDTRPLIRAIAEALAGGAPTPLIAGRFHLSLAVAVADACAAVREAHNVSQVALSGGVFQNGLLLRHLLPRLHTGGFAVFLPSHIPCNDGGLAVGQALIAEALLKQGRV